MFKTLVFHSVVGVAVGSGVERAGRERYLLFCDQNDLGLEID